MVTSGVFNLSALCTYRKQDSPSEGLNPPVFTVNCTDRINLLEDKRRADSVSVIHAGAGLTYLNGSYWSQQDFQSNTGSWWIKPFNWHNTDGRMSAGLSPSSLPLTHSSVCLAPGGARPIWPIMAPPRPRTTTCRESQECAEPTNLVCPSGVSWCFNTSEIRSS